MKYVVWILAGVSLIAGNLVLAAVLHLTLPAYRAVSGSCNASATPSAIDTLFVYGTHGREPWHLLRAKSVRGRGGQGDTVLVSLDRALWQIYVIVSDTAGHRGCPSNVITVSPGAVDAPRELLGDELVIAPSPVTSSLTASWRQVAGESSLEILDLAGRRELVLERQWLDAGVHQVTAPVMLTPGIHWLVLRIDGRPAAWRRFVSLR